MFPKKSFKTTKYAVAISIAATLIAAICFAAPFKSELMGPLPEFSDVFIKIFTKSIDSCDLAQIQKMHDLFNAQEKAALANYFPQEKWDSILAKVDPAKKSYLLGKYKEQVGKATPADMVKNFPRIMAINVNVMSAEQNTKVLASITDNEMAAIGFFLDNEGLRMFFTTMNADKHQLFLDRAPDWMLLELGLRNYDKYIKNYTCTLLKQERVKGTLQDQETITLKYRVKPNAIYMKWTDGPYKGREVIYNETVSKTSIRVREGGALGVVAVTVPLDSAIARRGTNHLVTEVGLKFLLGMIRTDWSKSHKIPGDLTRKNFGIQKLDGKNVYVMESIIKNNPSQKYYCGRLRHYIDYVNSVEIKAEVYNWNNELMEKYTYLGLKINTDLKEIDFDPNNPAYDL